MITQLEATRSKPFLKWAGGKTQLLEKLKEYLTFDFDNYIEPFLGGGALFFYLAPQSAILADSNPELINCYKVIRDKIEPLIIELKTYKNTSEFFYKIRSIDVSTLSSEERAARFIYLNKTCFNGLYRVNKKGEFNVPFGRSKNPKICDEDRLYLSQQILQGKKLICADYKTVLRTYAQKGDFVFLDPPYYSIGGYSDFQRYTKDFFYEDNHIELRNEFNRLVQIGCKSILTNSASEFIVKLYVGYKQEIVDTKRLISSKSETRVGQDLIISAIDNKKINVKEELLLNFPGTRYMGSKYKLLPYLWRCLKKYEFDSVLDAFAGSSCVSYMFKQKGIQVISNDYMSFSASFHKALIENNSVILSEKDIELLLQTNPQADNFIAKTFEGLYFTEIENTFLDNLRANIYLLDEPIKKDLALAAISRACMKRRPRGIFTYVGDRYDDGRRDLKIDLKQHFLENVEAFNKAVFDNGKQNLSFNEDIFDLNVKADLVYFDPPYLTSKSDNDYVRRYHFVEGFVKNWKGLEIQKHTQTKK